jgi:uncharacterized protein
MPWVLITGASKGIGFELARQFAKNGFDLLLVSRNYEKLREIARILEADFYVKTYCIAKDLSSEHASIDLFNSINDLHIDIQILVNNAGFGAYGDFETIDYIKHLQMISLNISSLTLLSQLFAKRYLERREGNTRFAILNIASIAAFTPGPLMAVYYASKAYVLSLSFALQEEFKDKGIQVSVLCPGPTHSEFASRAGISNALAFKMAMSSEEVAEIAFKEFMKSKNFIVPGIRNKILVWLMRLNTRSVNALINRKILESKNT